MSGADPGSSPGSRPASPDPMYVRPTPVNPLAQPIKARQWLPHPTLSVIMVGVWMLLTNGLGLGNLLLGLLLAWLIPWATQAFWPETLELRRPRVLFRLIALVMWDIVIANLTLAVRILGPLDKLQPAFFKVPLDIDHEFAIAMLASTISLTPGTVSADLSRDGRYLLIHNLHVSDIDAEIRLIKARYEAPLKEIFAC